MKYLGKRRFMIAGLVLVALLFTAVPATAAKAGPTGTIGYLSIPGITDGCSSVAGYENSCLVYGFEQGVVVTELTPPGGGGARAGKAELSLTVTKPVDRASVKLLGKAVTGTQIPEATIWLAQDGSFKSLYSMKLTHVYLLKVEQHYDALDPGNANLGQLEDVTFEFFEITWAWEPDLQFCFSRVTNDLC
jgi:type VI secretion system secreted protein Hcp